LSFSALALVSHAARDEANCSPFTPRENKQAPPSSADPDSSNREQLEISAYSFFQGVPP
jgi:hypothetical protein